MPQSGISRVTQGADRLHGIWCQAQTGPLVKGSPSDFASSGGAPSVQAEFEGPPRKFLN